MSGRGARSAILPHLALLAMVLTGMVVGYTTVHFCGSAMSDRSSVVSPAPDMPPAGTGTHDNGPLVLCLTAITAILAALVLIVSGTGGAGGLRRRRGRPSTVRGPPRHLARPLQRITVLRI